jgi:hypothetical protein
MPADATTQKFIKATCIQFLVLNKTFSISDEDKFLLKVAKIFFLLGMKYDANHFEKSFFMSTLIKSKQSQFVILH